jgi:preprotein translocase subunit SecA
MLKMRGVAHNVLNAKCTNKKHKFEEAGKPGVVTIAITCGRGTDIKLSAEVKPLVD